MRKQSGTMIALVIVLGALALTPVEVKAATPGCNPPADSGGECRGGSPQKWCEWHFGPYNASCCPPTQCSDGFRPQVPDRCKSDNATLGSLSDKSSGTAKRAVSQPETPLRRVSSELLTFVVLIGAIGGVIISIRKLLRPASVPLYRRLRVLPYPRAVEFAGLVVAATAARRVALTQAGSQQGRQASSDSPPRRRRPALTGRASAAAPRRNSVPRFSSGERAKRRSRNRDGRTGQHLRRGRSSAASPSTHNRRRRRSPAPKPTTSSSPSSTRRTALWARMANGATG